MSGSQAAEWGAHPNNDAPGVIAERFGRSLEWAREHVGPHRCVDGKFYRYSRLVSDPTCEALARGYMRLREAEGKAA